MMKALIRQEGETVTEADGIPDIDWSTGAPLTNPGWFGGPYILVNDYAPDDPTDDFMPAYPPGSVPAQDPPADTIVIDGVTYTRAP